MIRLLYPIQSLDMFRMETSPMRVIAFVAGLGLLVALLVFLSVSKKVKASKTFQSGTISRPGNRIKITPDFAKIAAADYMLDHAQIKLLYEKLKAASVDTGTFFESETKIDLGFNETLIKTRRDRGDETDCETEIGKLYEIRNAIDYVKRAREMRLNDDDSIVHKHRRTKVNISASFVEVVEKKVTKGMAKEKKLAALESVYTGNILNISRGGCLLASAHQLKVGGLTKIEFKIGNKKPAVLATIVRVKKEANRFAMNVRFLKVTKISSNTINSFVYNYKDI
jgi:hypothetical protein